MIDDSPVGFVWASSTTWQLERSEPRAQWDLGNEDSLLLVAIARRLIMLRSRWASNARASLELAVESLIGPKLANKRASLISLNFARSLDYIYFKVSAICRANHRSDHLAKQTGITFDKLRASKLGERGGERGERTGFLKEARS